jgi:hypothetical protein
MSNTPVALAVAIAIAPTTAAADGERTPMFGGSAVAAAMNEDALGGVGLEAAWWHWRVGLSAEGAVLWSVDDSARRVAMLGLSARLLVFDALIESLLEPRDVELGIELHGIIERTWWSQGAPSTDPNRYGIGVAVRLRGGGEYDLSSLLAESRVFLRVMASPTRDEETIARMISPPRDRDTGTLMIMIGLGASFGRGDTNYLERFRMEPFSPEARRLARDWIH